MSSTPFKRASLCLLWLAAAGAGLFGLSLYQNTAGAPFNVPPRWPQGAGMVAPAGPARPTLMLFVHPKCPCSRATIEELNRLLARAPGKANVIVYFDRPGTAPDAWTQTALWRSAQAIPGVTVREDWDGAQARLFGAKTSGTTLLYDARGSLLFHGGITPGRGHMGDNEGASTIVALLGSGPASLRHTAVFGCALNNDDARPVEIF